MKKVNLILLIFLGLIITSCIVENPKIEECDVEIETIINIKEGTSNDIVFSDEDGDHYYINRGLERGLDIKTLKEKVLNKRVTLHLPKLWFATSEYIAQLKVGDKVIYTEFN